MIHSEIPRTPFSTRLSGSAKETEGRLKNLFSGPRSGPRYSFWPWPSPCACCAGTWSPAGGNLAWPFRGW